MLTEEQKAVLAARQQLGRKFMDQNVPNWRDLIDWGKFDMSDSTCCIIGQCMPAENFEASCQALGLTLDDAIDLGFNEVPRESLGDKLLEWYDYIENAFDFLERLWREQ